MEDIPRGSVVDGLHVIMMSYCGTRDAACILSICFGNTHVHALPHSQFESLLLHIKSSGCEINTCSSPLMQ